MAGILRNGSPATTTYLASYTFDSGPGCVSEGWTSLDNSSGVDRLGGEMFHIDVDAD